jgi:hypothetical protein
MTSTIKVNTITTESGSTLTVGGCGKTVALASGASQTGFGREGSVNWQTSIKTATFTAANGEGYFIDTSSGVVTVNLPSASVGNIVAIKDYSGTFQTNNLTISPNGSDKIDGVNGNSIISTENASIVLVFADSTRGWLNVNDSTNVEGEAYITATGGTITTVCTNFKVHTFTGPGTFQVTGGSGSLAKVDYLVIAGGGSGGMRGGGGGAGGYRESSGADSGCYSRSPLGACVSSLPVSIQSYSIAVGGGGAAVGPSPNAPGNAGAVSTFSTITSAGGGFGGGYGTPQSGGPGGSGGGAPGNDNGNPATPAVPITSKGTGNTPPVSPPQGNDGGLGMNGWYYSGGGGGGATSAGGNGGGGPAQPSSVGGPGGNGATSSINATPTTRGGGGGAAAIQTAGTGGPGGGGAGSTPPGNGTAGTANTGGGGGGTQSSPNTSGAGGSGIVIIRYRFQ